MVSGAIIIIIIIIIIRRDMALRRYLATISDSFQWLSVEHTQYHVGAHEQYGVSVNTGHPLGMWYNVQDAAFSVCKYAKINKPENINICSIKLIWDGKTTEMCYDNEMRLIRIRKWNGRDL